MSKLKKFIALAITLASLMGNGILGKTEREVVVEIPLESRLAENFQDESKTMDFVEEIIKAGSNDATKVKSVAIIKEADAEIVSQVFGEDTNSVTIAEPVTTEELVKIASEVAKTEAPAKTATDTVAEVSANAKATEPAPFAEAKAPTPTATVEASANPAPATVPETAGVGRVQMVTLPDGTVFEYDTVTEARVTAYCPCYTCTQNYPGDPGYGHTYSGRYVLSEANPKLVAADLSKYPIGTIVYIPGYGIATVEDAGGAIVGERFDVYFHDHQEAWNWGIVDTPVYVSFQNNN